MPPFIPTSQELPAVLLERAVEMIIERHEREKATA